MARPLPCNSCPVRLSSTCVIWSATGSSTYTAYYFSCLRHPAPSRGFCVVPYVWYTSSLVREKQKERLARVYNHWVACPPVVLSCHKRRPLAPLHSQPNCSAFPRERSQRTFACSPASRYI